MRHVLPWRIKHGAFPRLRPRRAGTRAEALRRVPRSLPRHGYNGLGRIALPLRGRSADTVDVATAGGRGALMQVGVDEAGERLWFELKGAHRVVLEVSAKK